MPPRLLFSLSFSNQKRVLFVLIFALCLMGVILPSLKPASFTESPRNLRYDEKEVPLVQKVRDEPLWLAPPAEQAPSEKDSAVKRESVSQKRADKLNPTDLEKIPDADLPSLVERPDFGSQEAVEHFFMQPVSMKDSLQAFKGYTMWSSDYHSGPIACQLVMWRYLGIEVVAKITYPHCVHYDICRKDLKVLPEGHLGYSLTPCPYKTRRNFFNYYKEDAVMQDVDVFICTHPTANCEVFLPFNRSMIIYESQRLEFGRNDGLVPWRKNNIIENYEKSQQRWKEWITALTKRSDVVIAANNLYDVHYIKYHTNIDPLYIPADCQTAVLYKPTWSEFLYGGSRTMYAEVKIAAFIRDAFKSLNEATRENVQIRKIRDLYPLYKMSDIASHPGIVVIPYTVSTMSVFEFYRMGIPLFYPSVKLQIRWILQYQGLNERLYGVPEKLVENDIIYDPNSDELENLLYWLPLADQYQFPHIVYFDSPEDLHTKLRTTNLTEVHEKMMKENKAVRESIRIKWYNVFKKVLAGKSPGRHTTIADFDVAMHDIWNMTVGPNDFCLYHVV